VVRQRWQRNGSRLARIGKPISGTGDTVPVTRCFTRPLAFAGAFAHNPIITTAREQVAEAKAEITIARFSTNLHESDL